MLRASQAVIDVDSSGRVVGLNGYGDLTDVQRAAIVLKMQAVAHYIQNGFYIAQGRLKVLGLTSNVPVVQAYELVRGLFKSVTGVSLPVGSASAEVLKNVSNALTTLENGFKARVVPAIDQVRAGTLDPERWFAMAAPYSAGIASILDEVDESSTSALISKSVSELIADAKKLGIAGTDAFNKSLPYLPWMLGGVAVLLGLVVLSNLTAPFRALSGYSPKRRARRRIRG